MSTTFSEIYIVWEPCSIPDNFLMCLGAESRQYCRYTKSPLVITPLKEIWETLLVNENLTSVGFKPTTSGLDLPMLYRLSFEVTEYGSRSGNLGRESW